MISPMEQVRNRLNSGEAQLSPTLKMRYFHKGFWVAFKSPPDECKDWNPAQWTAWVDVHGVWDHNKAYEFVKAGGENI